MSRCAAFLYAGALLAMSSTPRAQDRTGGSDFDISVPTNAGVPYAWSVDAHASRGFTFTSETVAPPPPTAAPGGPSRPALVGGPLKVVFHIHPTAPRAHVVLEFRSFANRNAPPAKRLTFDAR